MATITIRNVPEDVHRRLKLMAHEPPWSAPHPVHAGRAEPAPEYVDESGRPAHLEHSPLVC